VIRGFVSVGNMRISSISSTGALEYVWEWMSVLPVNREGISHEGMCD